MNINGDNNDPFYRYKMPIINIQVLPNNTTHIININEISKSLNRNSSDIISFMKKELKSGGSKNFLSGTWSKNKLIEILKKYINENVLCSNCGNPETEYIIKKKNKMLACKACGCAK